MVPVATGQGMLPNNATVQNVTLQPNAEGKGEMVHIVATDAQGNIVTGGKFTWICFTGSDRERFCGPN